MNKLEILYYFSEKIQKLLKEYLTDYFELIEEIRLRVNKPMIIKLNNKDIITNIIINTEDLLQSLEKICEHSIYSYQNQISNGFITIKSGHRVGITGSVVIENNKVINIKYISSLNFRIAKQILNCSNNILQYVVNLENNSIYNTLIVSSPGVGKTTILRDLIRRISNGIENIKFQGVNVGVIDERCEISAMYKGIPQNDIGIRTDILENISKGVGIKMLIRSMAPQVVCADEIGTIEDIEAIEYAFCSGVKGIFTAHGDSMEKLKINPIINRLLNDKNIERIIFLSDKTQKCGISEVYQINNNYGKYEILSSKNEQNEYILK